MMKMMKIKYFRCLVVILLYNFYVVPVVSEAGFYRTWTKFFAV